MVALARRHPNLFVDTSAHRPRHLATPGSGWEMLLQFGNTLLQDKVLVGFSAEQFGLSIAEMVKLYEALPLKEAVVEKWLYGNARRFLRLP
jgi:predicted TIM-barrel fold metal-dependent hydrolase